MATGYARQSAAEIQTGNVIEAGSLNDEYDAILAFAHATTGHNHDGTIGGGALIPTAGLSGLTNTSAGLVAGNGANAFLARTLTGTANEITVTNGTGVSGNPTLSLPAALTFTGKTVTGGTFTSPAITTPTITGALAISANDGGALGSGAASWSDLFLASGGVINWNNGNVTLTHSAGVLTANTQRIVESSAVSTTFGGNPASATDGVFLLAQNTDNTAGVASGLTLSTRASSAAFSGIYNVNVGANSCNQAYIVENGAHIFYGTTTASELARVTSGGDLQVTAAGTTSTSVVTLAATQTLTNKTLTVPTLTLKQSASPTPTAEGDIQWDTDDNLIVVGDGASQQIFRPVLQSTFTPTVRGSGTAGTWTYTTQSGTYHRIGNRITFNIVVLISSYAGSPTGRLQVLGLPVAAASVDSAFFCSGTLATPGAGNVLEAYLTAGGTTLDIYGRAALTGAATDSTIAASGVRNFFVSGTYVV